MEACGLSCLKIDPHLAVTLNDSRRPLVYLDSSDFSVLSDPRRLTPALEKVLFRLRQAASESLVDFRFSVIHVCEIAPVSTSSQEAARRRAQLIWDLCGTHALIDHHSLLRQEVLHGVLSATSNEGKWYPPIDDFLPTNIFGHCREELDATFRREGMNREHRRKAKRMAFGKHGLTAAAAAVIDKSFKQPSIELLKSLPLTDAELRDFHQYCLSGAKRHEVEVAIHRIFSDPRWIIEHLASPSEDALKVMAWLRDSGTGVAELFAGVAAKIKAFRLKQARLADNLVTEWPGSHEPVIDEALNKHATALRQRSANFEKTQWSRMQISSVNTLVDRIATDDSVSATKADTLADCRLRYPGINAFVASSLHSARQASTVSPRDPQVSDHGDALHALYAPYVDIFRADVFMADTIEESATSSGTRVVRRLIDLPDVIESMLVARNLSHP